MTAAQRSLLPDSHELEAEALGAREELALRRARGLLRNEEMLELDAARVARVIEVCRRSERERAPLPRL